MKASNATCTLSGSGNMYVYIEDKLEAFLSRSRNIVHYGSPVVNSNLSGNGHIFKKTRLYNPLIQTSTDFKKWVDTDEITPRKDLFDLFRFKSSLGLEIIPLEFTKKLSKVL